MPPALLSAPALIPSMAIGAGALSAGSSVLQGIAAKRAADVQAQAYQAQAGLEKERAGAIISAQDYQANQLMALARANAAASGVNPSSGSAKVIGMMNMSESLLRDTAARYSGELQSSAQMAAAANARLEGRQALYGGLIKAGSTALTTGLYLKAPVGTGGLGL